MRIGQVKTQSQINQLKGDVEIKVTQRYKKEITLKQKKEVDHGELEPGNG